jgi:heme/copper-type cytochrome/quinol oxidase subunit 2
VEGSERTHMLAAIDYGMIILFFVVLLVLLVFIANPRANAQPSQAVSPVPSSVKEKGVAYSFLLALFLLLIVLSWYTQRTQKHTSST